MLQAPCSTTADLHGAGSIVPPDTSFDAAVDGSLTESQLLKATMRLLRELKRTLNDERGSAEWRLRHACAVLDDAQQSPVSQQRILRGGLAPWQMRKVGLHIDSHLDGPIRNDALAAVARLTTCHFARAFRNSFGVPPHEYVIQRRIDRAKALMLSTDAPLGQIALECGLADQAHFSRLFHKVVGENPRNWRRLRVEPQTLAEGKGSSGAGQTPVDSFTAKLA